MDLKCEHIKTELSKIENRIANEINYTRHLPFDVDIFPELEKIKQATKEYFSKLNKLADKFRSLFSLPKGNYLIKCYKKDFGDKTSMEAIPNIPRDDLEERVNEAKTNHPFIRIYEQIPVTSGTYRHRKKIELNLSEKIA